MSISVFDLPHILEAIRDGLPPSDYASCSLVCHAWSLVFRRLTWRAFVLKERDYSKLLANSHSRKLFDDRVRTIEELTIFAHDALRPFKAHLIAQPEILKDQLTRLSFTGGCLSRSLYHSESIECLLQILERNASQLVHVDAWIKILPLRFVDRLRALFPAMKSLKTLSFKGDGTISPRDLTIILRTYPPTLESLEIDYPNIYADRAVALWDLYSDGPTDWERYDDPTNSWRLLAWFWSGAPQSSIRRLVLPRCDGYPEKICPVLLLFLKHRGGKLAHFKLPNMEPAPRPKDLITALSRCPEIRHLEFESITREMLLLYPAAIQACRSLESLTVSGSVFDARGVMQALVDHHASTIKRIRWTGGGGFEGGLDMELFLKTCPNLERLETSHGSLVSYTGQGASGSMWIKNIPLPSTPDLMQWICWASLTYLDITFYVDRNIVNEQQFRDQIELTYKKLGQLTALEELHLGCECRCIGPQLQYCDHSQLARSHRSVSTASMFQHIEAQAKYDLCSPSSPTEMRQHGVNNDIDRGKLYDVQQPNDGAILDLSLATGLAHLADLKKLRTLNISRIKGHRIGYHELEWMRDNWPQLTTFKGLRNTALWKWVHTNWIVAPSASQDVE